MPDNDPLHSTICQLVPWEIARIEIARVPTQRRFPIDITYTHRGAAIEYQDGNISIEAEALDGMHFPNQRFAKAASLAIFWFGIGEPEQVKPAPSTTTIDVVTFPNIPNDVPGEVKAAVKRLHLNLGHPGEKEPPFPST